jgi:hypothetical protein
VYSYVTYAFAIRFNVMFLTYVALLGCSTYALVGGLATTDQPDIQARFKPHTPIRAVCIYLMVVVVLFYLLWLGEVVPALLTGAVPQSILEDGTPTNAVYVVDMAWLLPAFVITAVRLWRRQPLGYTLAGALLTNLVLLVLAILSMGVFQMQQGDPGAVPMVVLFAALAAASLGMLLWYVRGLEASSTRPIGPMAVTRAGSSISG